MSYLRQKSEFNITAAQFLIEKNLYAPSIHCSYYSCLQLLKVVVKEFIGINYDDQESEISSGKSNSHKYVIDKVLNEIRIKNRFEYIDMRRNITDLKTFREKSDYYNIEIDISKSQNAFERATEIRNYLTKQLL